jgi:hypothetical protein
MVVRLLEPQVPVPDETRILFPLAVEYSEPALAVPFGFGLV